MLFGYGRLLSGYFSEPISRSGDRLKEGQHSAILTAVKKYTSVKIVHDIEKRREIILGLIGAVHAIVDGSEANAVLREGDLRIEAHTEVISTYPAEVFYKDNAHLTGFNVGNQAFPVWTLKYQGGITILPQSQ